jgi:hypothetical protein
MEQTMKNRVRLAVLSGAVFAVGGAITTHAGAGTDRPANAEKNQQGEQPSGGVWLTDGMTLIAELSGSLDSKKDKVGDPVKAQLSEAVKHGGKTLLPRGIKLLGHLTQTSARAKGDSQTTLAIQFDKAVLKNGEEIPLSVWIRALAAEPRNVYQPGPSGNPIAGTGSAAEAGSPMGPRNASAGGVTPIPQVPTAGANNPATGVPTPASAPDSGPDAAGGLNPGGQLTPDSRGVFGLDGVHLATDASSAAQGSLITSSGKNLHLDGGTRMLLVVQAQAAAHH